MARGSLRVVPHLEVKRRLDGEEVGAVTALLDEYNRYRTVLGQQYRLHLFS